MCGLVSMSTVVVMIPLMNVMHGVGVVDDETNGIWLC